MPILRAFPMDRPDKRKLPRFRCVVLVPVAAALLVVSGQLFSVAFITGILRPGDRQGNALRTSNWKAEFPRRFPESDIRVRNGQFSAALPLAVAGLMLGVIGNGVRRKTPRQREARQSVVVAASSNQPWAPRCSGWSKPELEAEKARILALEEPDASTTGIRYQGRGSITDAFIEELISMQENGQLLPKQDAYMMVLDVIELLQEESTVQEISIPQGKELTVVGDLHGQYWDFMNMLKLAGRPSVDAPFVFNGDFVDRGSWSIEVILVLIAMKLQHPDSVFLNRGNHEMLETNMLYGFCGECGAKYDMGLFDLFSEMFRNLPLGHLVDKKILVLHGGLPGPDPRIWMPGQTHDPTDAIPMGLLPSLDRIKEVERYTEITPDNYPETIGPTTQDKDANDTRMLIDILWGDPRGGPGYGPSYRKGKGVYMFGPDITEEFCKRSNLQCIIRSHEVKAAGWRWDHPKLLSVFSAPNYLDTGNNKGAFVKLSRPNPDGNIVIKPTSYDAVEHPELQPMHWQDNITQNYPHLTRKMKKKVQQNFDEFGDSDFGGVMNVDEWEPEEAEAFQEAFKLDQYGREKPSQTPNEEPNEFQGP